MAQCYFFFTTAISGVLPHNQLTNASHANAPGDRGAILFAGHGSPNA
jgi:hypothetical protein